MVTTHELFFQAITSRLGHSEESCMIKTAAFYCFFFLLTGFPCGAQMSPSATAGYTQSRDIGLKHAQDQYQTAMAKRAVETDPTRKQLYNHQAEMNAFWLGQRYERGEPSAGAVPDYSDAQFWYRKGAEIGNADSACALAQLYWDGKGVPLDRERAKYIWMMAAQNQDPREGAGARKSITKLEALGFDMQKERESAFKQARDFRDRRSMLTLNHPRSLEQEKSDAIEGAGLFFGLIFGETLARGPESPECEAYHRMQLVGGTLPPGVMPPSCP
jgi:TPR repeat protein